MTLVPVPIREESVFGRRLGGIEVEIFERDTTTPVPIFEDSAGSIPVDPPYVTNVEGALPGLWMEPGPYDRVTVSDLVDARVPFEAVSGADTAILGVVREAPLNIDYPEFGGSLDAAIQAANAMPGNDSNAGIYVPGADRTITTGLTTLTKNNTSIFGDGPGVSKLTLTDNTGTFFTLGSALDDARDVRIHDLGLSCTGTPTAHAIVASHAHVLRLDDLEVSEVAGFIRSGDGDECSGLNATRIRGTILDGSDLDWFHLQRTVGSVLLNVHLNSNADVVAPTDGAYVHIDGALGICDNIQVLGCTLFNNPGPGGEQGQPLGFRIDARVNAVNNVHIISGTTDGAETFFRFQGDSTADTARGFHVIGHRCEIASGDGRLVWITHADGGLNHAQNFAFANNLLMFGNGTGNAVPILCIGNAVEGVSFIANKIQQAGSGNPGQLFSMSVDDFQIIANKIHRGDGDALNTNHIVGTEADVDNFNVSGNVAPATNTGFFDHFAYANWSPNRRVYGNTPHEAPPSVVSAATITPPPGEYRVLDVTGTTDITSITPTHDGHVLTLRFAGNKTVVDGLNLHLNGDFAVTIDDTLTLVCDGTNWDEIARSAN